ncbi:GNAT family N-acetyltransferase [Aquincola tertiaricarbonis]|uniref:GNAT family N-acetyltransferase n=1 Tax=Aquincola tertiaricarbonis TaxID=391953 RepID=A0A1S6R6J7_AQUTE|nr:GNAT family N-acetyltransferase [Aquincola tertiaricarbonis]AQW45601.1 hypothetical protein [Aquincola tertiaricarbonis]URI10263.1 GNAT family N-acetyltransferase [Aquincola tertiaricarbonis]
MTVHEPSLTMPRTPESPPLPAVPPPWRWHAHRLAGVADFEAHAPAWDQLLQRLWGDHPMLSAAFVGELLRRFGSGREWLLVGRNTEGTVQGMAVLRRGRGGMWASFVPSQAQIAPVLLADGQGIAAMYRALPGFAWRIDFLCNDPDFGDLAATAGRQPNTSWHALTTAVDLVGGFEAYWADRPTKLKKYMRRYERKISAAGPVRFVVVTQPEAVAQAVARYAVIESSGWKGRAGTALRVGNDQFDFYQTLLARQARQGGAEVYELWLGEQQLASRLTLVSAQQVLILKTTYDEVHSEFSPSHLLLYRTLEHAFEFHAGKRVEFYTNATREQRLWSTAQRHIQHASYSRYEPLQAWVRVARALRARLLRPMWRPGTQSTSASLAATVALPADLERLMSEAETAGIERGHAWFANLCAHVPTLAEHGRFEVARGTDGEVLAVMPTQHLPRKGWRGAALYALSNFYSPLYTPVLTDNVTRNEMASMLHQAMRRAGACRAQFFPLDVASREYSLLRDGFITAGLPVFQYFCFTNWYLPVKGDWATYLANRPGSTRSLLLRRGRKFAALGGTLEVITGGERLEAGLQAFADVYAASWKQPEPHPGFVPGLMRASAERGWLRLGVAWLDGKAIAAQFWLVNGRKAWIYKLAHDAQQSTHSPGTLLTGRMIEAMFNSGEVDEIDYLTGDDPFKRDWMTHRHERWGLVAFDPSTLSGLAGMLRELLGQTVKSLLGPLRQRQRLRRAPTPETTR